MMTYIIKMTASTGATMRITKRQADDNKARVIETAAALFREKGFDGVSVADLMRKAGMTHGGFYNHFDSKDALEAAACAYIFDQSVEGIASVAAVEDTQERAAALADYKRRYVSKKGRDATAARCPMVAFAGDVSRQSAHVREEYAQGLRRYLDAFAQACDAGGENKPDAKKARRQAIVDFVALSGALTLARSVAEADPELSDEILEAAAAAFER
jgi:TetR/AcrR family transcriptional regulator, transcriptional repressor for nem operon